MFLAIAIGILAYLTLNFWSLRHAPLHVRLERLWKEDVYLLESSGKLPPAWYEIAEIEVIGGTPQTKNWLKRIQIPLKPKGSKGKYNMEILVVAWEEDGIHGALVQYNLTDIATRNTVFELGRTLILADAKSQNPVRALMESLRQ